MGEFRSYFCPVTYKSKQHGRCFPCRVFDDTSLPARTKGLFPALCLGPFHKTGIMLRQDGAPAHPPAAPRLRSFVIK